MFRKLRLVFLAVIGVPCLLFTGGLLAYTALFGDGEVVVVAPEGRDLALKLDGQSVSVARGQHQAFKVKQGTHTVSFGATDKPVAIKNGFTKLLVPSSSDQCFVLLDVSNGNYIHGTHMADPFPRIVARIPSTAPYDLSASVHFSEAELPRSIKDNETCELLREAPCEALKGDDLSLLKDLGLGP
jgi:hypothetical protein